MTKQPIIINAPPSKSLSHRTLIAAALANGVSEISAILNSDRSEERRVGKEC